MDLRVEATRDEYEHRSADLVRAVARIVGPFDDVAHAVMDAVHSHEYDDPGRVLDVPALRDLYERLHVRQVGTLDRVRARVAAVLERDGLVKAELGDPQYDEIREIVAAAYRELAADFVGADNLPVGERPDDVAHRSQSAIEHAYLIGLLLARAPESSTLRDLSLSDLDIMLGENPILLTSEDHDRIRSLERETSERIRHLGSGVLVGVVVAASAAARAESRATLASNLEATADNWRRDWERAASVSIQDARQHGAVRLLATIDAGEAHVFKIPRADACSWCILLHIGPDGQPRIFPISALEANGTNTGRRKSEWRAVIGATHPNCACQLRYMPPGHGFDERGDVVPDGPYGVRYRDEHGLARALVAEAELQKAFRLRGSIRYQGLDIAVENRPGDVRRWHDPLTGRAGETRMKYTYGYVRRTEGADGEGYDCYVGPDPDAPFVYIIHQNNPNTGEYDEDKAMIGWSNPHAAKAAYLAHYDDPRFFGSMSQITLGEFKAKLVQTRRSGQDGMIKARSVRPRYRRTRPGERLVLRNDRQAVLEKSTGAQQSLNQEYSGGSQYGKRSVVTGGAGPMIVTGAPPRNNPRADTAQTRAIAFGAVKTKEQLEIARDNRSGLARDIKEEAHRMPPKLMHEVAEIKGSLHGEGAKDARDRMHENKRTLQRRLDGRDRASVPNNGAERLLIQATAAAQRGKDIDEAVKDEKGERAARSESPLDVGEKLQQKKRGLGIVTLKALENDRFGTKLPNADVFVEHDSLTAACDYVWAVQKGYRDAADYRSRHKKRVPSGAGWKFWGVKRRA